MSKCVCVCVIVWHSSNKHIFIPSPTIHTETSNIVIRSADHRNQIIFVVGLHRRKRVVVICKGEEQPAPIIRDLTWQLVFVVHVAVSLGS